jgi:Flp pilus assembly protein CpaB
MAVGAPARRGPSPAAKPATRKPLFVIGIVMAVIAFILVIVLGSVVAGRATVSTAQVPIVVASNDIQKRHVITDSDLTITRIPATAAPPGALLQTTLAVGKVTQVSVLKGQPVTANLFAPEGQGDPAYLPVPAGWNAVTIPAGEMQAVAGYLAPGDVIDIEATVPETVFKQVANPRQLTRTVFPGVHVLRLGPAGTSTKSGQPIGVVTSLTVLMTPCNAQYLTWLIQAGVVRYNLRSATDYGPPPTAPDPACPVGANAPPLPRIGPAEVDKQFVFTTP